MLYVASGSRTFFVDQAIGEGLGAPSRLASTFGVLFFDYDLDGRLDILKANGHPEDEIDSIRPIQRYEQPAQLFWNAGSVSRATFVVLPAEHLGDLGRPFSSRGVTYADIDGDGDLDVLLFQPQGRPRLLRNDRPQGQHWLRVRLQGEPRLKVSRDAIGAWVEVTSGGVTQRRQVMPARGYLSQVELPLTFGLGSNARIESVKVRWPNGDVQVIENVPPDQVLAVTQAAR